MSRIPALLGGSPVRQSPFPAYPVLGNEEREAVLEVLKEGRLSTFTASPGEYFSGGKRIKAFESEFAAFHRVKHAVAFNSATAALHSAVVALGIEPGQEIITSPYTFTSSATCALMHNAIPVFADVERDTFCLDPVSVRKAITPLTRAIIPVHLFGHPAAMDSIMEMAREHNLKVIEDCAQAPGALYKEQRVGTIGDCGVFSFQESKNIMTGEGGMLITNIDDVAEIARLVRNHGEAIADAMQERSYASEILGYNYRMTEFEAALGRVQLSHLEEWNAVRQKLAAHLSKELREIPGILPPAVSKEATHVYYVYPFLFDENRAGIPRDLFAAALQAEGIPVGVGYVRPLYFSPIFQNRRTFAFKHYQGNARYTPGLCPVAEDLHFRKLLLFPVVRPPATLDDMNDILTAVKKTIDAREALLTKTTSPPGK